MEQLPRDLKVYTDDHLFLRQTKKWMANNQTDSYENVWIACADFICVGFWGFLQCVEWSLLSYITLYLYFILYVLFSALSCQRTATGNKQTSIIRHKASFLYGIRL